jgi:plastocyanin
MPLHRRAFNLLLAGTGLALGARGVAHAEDFQVEVHPSLTKFEPEAITIKVGDTVTWTNPQLVTHTVTCDPAKAKIAGSASLPAGAPPFDSGDMGQDATFQHRFTVKGEYRYFCVPHEEMKMIGTVTVV